MSDLLISFLTSSKFFPASSTGLGLINLVHQLYQWHEVSDRWEGFGEQLLELNQRTVGFPRPGPQALCAGVLVLLGVHS